MRQNFPGLAAWTLLLLGIAAGGVWLVMLGRPDGAAAWPWGTAAIVGLAAGGALMVTIRYQWHNDPLEPETTDEEAAVYRRRRRRHDDNDDPTPV
ncbi:hypothetical protein [Tomitella gaofuii]|uniref:hypothetical protein n=1 Tax=Tomitella gaofuii TaxID=2760083 RepID=UPI0015FD3D28|nr:hypothetical protein [Tomitella gaofuii]